jgi:ribosomal protein L16 Arg81 hydroxylase
MFMSLEQLFGSDEGKRFLKEILGQSSVHVKGEAERFSGLISWGTINEILQYRALRAPRVKAVKGTAASVGGPPGSALQTLELTALLAEGATLVIDQIDELHAPIGLLCKSLERDLGVPVQANLYATWGNEPGFHLHWDDHDVIVAQILGRKQWGVHGQTTKFPLPGDHPPEPVGPPVWQGIVAAGDVLYVPRGWWHCVTPLGEPTIHLSIGLSNPNGIDIMRRILKQLRQVEIMRMDCPRYGPVELQDQYLSRIQKAISDACTRSDLVTGYVRDMQSTISPRPIFGLPWSVAEVPVPASGESLIISLVRFPTVIETLEEESAIEVCHGGKRFRFHELTRDLLNRVLDCEPLTAQKFFELFENRFPQDQLVGFLSDLAKHGLVVFRD